MPLALYCPKPTTPSTRFNSFPPTRLIVLGCLAFLLAGCGKKGDLYLPDTPAATASIDIPPPVSARP